jgi:cobalt-zinc-cadmium resistance protein CzcA
MSFSEVTDVLAQTGRSNDGTDPNGFGFVQFAVNLKPKEEWKRKITYEELIEEIDKKLRTIRELHSIIPSRFQTMWLKQ